MNNRNIALLNRFVLVSAALFFVYDLWGDILEGEPWFHFALESAVFVLVVIALSYEIITGIRLRSLLSEHQQQLSELRGRFADKIKQQFQKWELTQSETEVAWLIVKGFSFEEIAYLREVKEKTVRQQATAVYSKSNTKSRNELTAVFIEDLLTAEV